MPPKASSSSKKKLRSILKSVGAQRGGSAAASSSSSANRHGPRPSLSSRSSSHKSKSRAPSAPRTPARHMQGGKMRGRGAYEWVDDSKLKQFAGDSIGGTIGAAAGRVFGNEGIGRTVGNGIHKAFRWLTGRGSYKERMAGFQQSHGHKENLLDGTVPEFGTAKEYVEIAYRERFGQVLSSVNFVNTSYDINPGLAAMFPFLNTIASQYEQYSFQGVVVQYKTLCTPYASSTPALGQVVMNTKYGAQEPLADSLTVALNSDYSTSSVPTASFLHAVECDPRQGTPEVKYVRSGPGNAWDLNSSDQGTFQVITSGQATTGDVLGELWVTYKVRLYKPQIAAAGRNSVAHYRTTYANGTVTTPFANAVAMPGTTLPITFNGTALRMPKTPGTYMLTMGFTVLSTNSIVFSGTPNISSLSTDVVGLPIFALYTAGGSASSVISSVSALNAVLAYAYKYTGAIAATANDISFSFPTLTSSNGTQNNYYVQLDLFVVPMSPGMSSAWANTYKAVRAQADEDSHLLQRMRLLMAAQEHEDATYVCETREQTTIDADGNTTVDQWLVQDQVTAPPTPTLAANRQAAAAAAGPAAAASPTPLASPAAPVAGAPQYPFPYDPNQQLSKALSRAMVMGASSGRP